MTIKNINKLIVKYNNRVVGYLAIFKDDKIGFQYDAEWLKNGFSISPFSLPLTDEIFINTKKNFDGLYGVFWDCLPDGWGELLVKRMLAKHGVNYDNLTPLQKLSIIGKNGLGALEFEPCNNDNNFIFDADLDVLAKETQKILNDEIDNLDLDTIYNLGGSSGGARPKAHIKRNNEEWIVKFPCLIDPQGIGELECKANSLAKECEINVNDFKLFDSKICAGYFGAKRFDRENDKKIHTISLCALLETSHRIPNLDYGHLFQVVQNISVDKINDMYEVFKRMCFNVLYKNKDDHGKNFAFIYEEKLKGFTLSPAYDITATPNKMEHEMTINGNPNPTEKDLFEIANQFKLSKSKCKNILDCIKNKLKNKQ